MRILAIDSSTKSASCAVVADGTLLCFSVQSVGLTHSRTLLPMVSDMLKNAAMSLAGMDAIAVAAGPGSFTGLRIGTAAAKGLCMGAGLPAVGVSTLEAAACAADANGIVLAALDARRGEVYYAVFDGTTRLTDDAAAPVAVAVEAALSYGTHVTVVGDAAYLVKEFIPNSNKICYNDFMKIPNAIGVALAAAKYKPQNAAGLAPVYLRVSQAEREAAARQSKSN